MENSASKKKIFWLVIVVFPFVALAVLEVVLRWTQYGDNLDLTFVQDINGKKYYTINSAVSRRYFPSHASAAPKVYDNTFEFNKSPNTCRIFCIGESTMQGFPYEYNGSLPVLLKDRLLDSFQGKKIEVVNLGITAINSYAVLDLTKEVVQYQPDLIIVYAGHNEFYGSFGVGSVEYFGKNRTFVNFYLKLNRLKIVQLLRNTITRARVSLGGKDQPPKTNSLMELMARDKQIPFHSDLYETAKSNFRENLNDIVDVAASHNVAIMLSTVVSNLHDLSPFNSEFSPSCPESQKKQWLSLVDEGKKLNKEQNFSEAVGKFYAASAIDSSRADLHYDIAVCLEGVGDTMGAKYHFERARDYDIRRFRASGEFNDIIRDVAQTKNALLADNVKTLEHESPHNIVGKDLMLDHVHPTLNGYFLIAKEFVRVMQLNDCILPSSQWHQSSPDDFYMYVSMMTLFDFEVSFLRMDNLKHHWPFSDPDSTRYQPTTVEGNIARSYILGQMTWDQAHYQLAEMYARQHKLPNAEREYLALAKEFWYDYRPMLSAGDVNMAVKNYSNAEKYFKAALERENNQYTQVRFGALYQELQQPEVAARYYQMALDIDLNAPTKFKKEWKLQVMLHLGQVYLQLGDYTKARRAAKDALALDPTFLDARKLLTNVIASDPAHSTQ